LKKGSNSAIEPSNHNLDVFCLNPYNSSVSQSKFFPNKLGNNPSKMEIESPMDKTPLGLRKVSHSAGQTKKRKLSNKNLRLNSEGISRKFDPFFDCFTPKLEQTKSSLENTKAFKVISRKIAEEFVVQEVFIINYEYFLNYLYRVDDRQRKT